jgi:adenylylsulfate kinase-like enzyme
LNNVEVLILHGSPGSGKSTLAHALFERLREAEQLVAAIDPDELRIVHPNQARDFSRRNLKAIWPNYTAAGNLRAIIPTVIADAEDLRLLREALPASRFIICELMASKAVLKQRVSVREPNDYWKKRLENWVDVYSQRDASQKFGDFEVTTDGKSINDTITEILEKVNW